MRGKGVSKTVSLLFFFLSYVLFYRVAPKLFQIIILFGFNFGIFSWFLGVLWIYFVGLLGPLESFFVCGPKSEKMSNVPRENGFFEKVVFFWCLRALDGPHGFISASFGPM